VLLYEVLQAALLEELKLVLLHEELDFGATAQIFTRVVAAHSERTAGSRLPHVLLIVTVLRGHDHLVGHQVGRIETDTELTDHAHIGTRGNSLCTRKKVPHVRGIMSEGSITVGMLHKFQTDQVHYLHEGLVLDCAIVPRLFTMSALVMPTPESMMESELLVLSG